MLVFYSINEIPEIENSVITIGNFDGLHHAHQKIIKDTVNRAKQILAKSVVITFEPHPLKFFKKTDIKLIQTLSQKLECISLLGVNLILVLKFDKELSEMSAVDFVDKVLIKRLGMKELYIGYNFQFGKAKEGDINMMIKFSNMFNFKVYVQEPIMVDGIICNSTTIRNFIERGDIEVANKLLDRFYSISGVVIKGESIGRVIGYPTINIQTENELLPLEGVYLTYVIYDNKSYPSVTNIGYRPTFKGKNKSIESYIIDFNKELYGEKVQLLFLKRLRDEKKFDSTKELIEQIIKDVKYARHYFNI